MTPAEASALMKRGIALLEANTPASLEAALPFFEQAIAYRRDSLAPGDSWAAYLLAASWMNRGDALTRLGSPDRLAEALRAYDAALATLRAVPPGDDPRYRRRHAIAWINRGLTLQAQDTPSALAEAVRSFATGAELVRDHPEHAALLAGAWMNHANALLCVQPARAEEAQRSAASALALAKATETQDLMAAEAGLKARLVLCQAVVAGLADAPEGDALDRVGVATDAAEAGLKLARHWEDQGEARFAPLLTRFLHFGLAIYRRYQPQFLTEFVLDHLRATDGPERHALAADVLSAEARRLPPDGFASMDSPRFGRLLETLRALRVARQHTRDGKRLE